MFLCLCVCVSGGGGLCVFPYVCLWERKIKRNREKERWKAVSVFVSIMTYSMWVYWFVTSYKGRDIEWPMSFDEPQQWRGYLLLEAVTL